MNYEDFLYNLTQKDERYIVMTAENRGPMRGLPDKIKAGFIDTGITEQTMIGMSAGLALRGRIPIVHAMSCFLTMRAFEFIRTDIGLGSLPVKLMGTMSGFLSEANGPTHQALEDISLMRGIPGMNIFSPADEEDMLAGLLEVFESKSPYYIRFSNNPFLIKHAPFKIGRAEIIGEGTEVCILTYGFMFSTAFEAKKILEKKGISARLINLRTLKPIDSVAIAESADKCRLLATIEDHFLIGGLYSIIAEIFLEKKITAKVVPFALKEKWFKPGLLNDVLEYEGFTPKKIAGKIIEALK